MRTRNRTVAGGCDRRKARGRTPWYRAILAAAAAALLQASPAPLPAEPAVAAPAQETCTGACERGRYLVTVSACHDCHTPFIEGPNGAEPDSSRLLSGHPESLAMPAPPPLPDGPWRVVVAGSSTAWSGPWGVSFTANLTPDPETGLGKWSFRNFRDTIRTGRHLGRGRALLPPMPIPMYKHFSDADLEAIFTYLQSIPAVSNRVPLPVPPADP